MPGFFCQVSQLSIWYILYITCVVMEYFDFLLLNFHLHTGHSVLSWQLFCHPPWALVGTNVIPVQCCASIVPSSVVFEGPVLWTTKRPVTAHKQTGKDQTSGCSCVDFSVFQLLVAAFAGIHATNERPVAISCNQSFCNWLQPVLQPVFLGLS